MLYTSSQNPDGLQDGIVKHSKNRRRWLQIGEIWIDHFAVAYKIVYIGSRPTPAIE